jgi:hypothetical protein
MRQRTILWTAGRAAIGLDVAAKTTTCKQNQTQTPFCCSADLLDYRLELGLTGSYESTRP